MRAENVQRRQLGPNLYHLRGLCRFPRCWGGGAEDQAVDHGKARWPSQPSCPSLPRGRFCANPSRHQMPLEHTDTFASGFSVSFLPKRGQPFKLKFTAEGSCKCVPGHRSPVPVSKTGHTPRFPGADMPLQQPVF